MQQKCGRNAIVMKSKIELEIAPAHVRQLFRVTRSPAAAAARSILRLLRPASSPH